MEIIKILILQANPLETEALAFDHEQNVILEQYNNGKYKDNFDIKISPSFDGNKLQNVIYEYQPNILHFSGHGDIDNIFFSTSDNKYKHPINKHVLGKIFQNTPYLEAIYFNACYGAINSSYILKNVKYLIGSVDKIKDQHAICFSKGFYTYIFNNNFNIDSDIEKAVNAGYSEMEISGVDNNFQKKIVLKKQYLENNFTEIINNEDYNLLTEDTYKLIINKIDIINSDNCFDEIDKLVAKDLLNKIQRDLDKKGISFITAPICFGKTFYLKYIKKKSIYNFVREINGDVLSIKKCEIKSINNLYFIWFKTISESILTKANFDKLDLKSSIYKKIENQDEFNKWLEYKRDNNMPGIQAFIECLIEFKKHVNYFDTILVSFHLDEVHKYIDNNIFQSLRNDLVNYSDYNFNEKTVKILVASRYFPYTHKNKGVTILPYFEMEQISYLSNFLIEEMNKDLNESFSFLVLNKTDGYPWFVIRFFLIYLLERINKNKDHPLNLANYIFDNEEFWITDSIFGNEKDSKYFRELIKLITNNIGDATLIENFRNFVQLESKQTVLSNGNFSRNDFLLQQSGFLKIDSLTDQFKNNGCYIMKKHYLNKIESYLN